MGCSLSACPVGCQHPWCSITQPKAPASRGASFQVLFLLTASHFRQGSCPSPCLLMQRQCPDGFFLSALYCYWICVLVFIYILDSKGSPVLEYIQAHRRGHIKGEFSLTASWGKGIFCTFCAEPGATIHHQRNLRWGRPNLKSMQIKVNLLELLWCKKMASSNPLSSRELQR